MGLGCVVRAGAGDARHGEREQQQEQLLHRFGAIHPPRFEDLARHRVVQGSLSANKANAIGWIWDIYRQQEGIGPLRSTWYMFLYGMRGVYKNVRHKRLQHY